MAVVAMQDAGYVLTAWGLALVSLGGYAAYVIRRGRALARRVPPEERRWT